MAWIHEKAKAIEIQQLVPFMPVVDVSRPRTVQWCPIYFGASQLTIHCTPNLSFTIPNASAQ